MSARAVERALERLSASDAVLAPVRAGEQYGVFPRGDRRRRPAVRIDAASVRALEAEGAVTRSGEDAFVLTPAGAARVRREAGGAFVAQHAELIEKDIVDTAGVRRVRALRSRDVVQRLGKICGVNGAPWFDAGELAAAARLGADWELGQLGLVRGSDWSAPPLGGAARGPGNVQERAIGRQCDARARLADALAALTPGLRRVVERVCFHEQGLEEIERAEGWPPRSAKLALKLALAQVAAGDQVAARAAS